MSNLLTLYTKGVRTPETREAWRQYRRDERLRKGPEVRHGLKQYRAGCRCLKCLEANHHYQYRHASAT